MRYLLDTNIVSDLIRNPAGLMESRIQKLGERLICTSIVVASELRYGAAKRGSSRFARRVEEVLEMIKVLPFAAPADTVYGNLRARLEALGRTIGANDLFIAAHALALDCTLVTDNEREFARVEGLTCENWLRWS